MQNRLHKIKKEWKQSKASLT